EAFDNLLAAHHLDAIGVVHLLYTHRNFLLTRSCLHTTIEAKAKDAAAQALLIQLYLDIAIGVQALLDPALHKTPESGQYQVVEGRHDKQFKDRKGRRAKSFRGIGQVVDADHRGDRGRFEHIVELIA